jgi:ribosomal protein L44E
MTDNARTSFAEGASLHEAGEDNRIPWGQVDRQKREEEYAQRKQRRKVRNMRRALKLTEAKEKGHKIGSVSNRCKRCGMPRERAAIARCGTFSFTTGDASDDARTYLLGVQRQREIEKKARAANRGKWKALRKGNAPKPEKQAKKKKGDRS